MEEELFNSGNKKSLSVIYRTKRKLERMFLTYTISMGIMLGMFYLSSSGKDEIPREKINFDSTYVPGFLAKENLEYIIHVDRTSDFLKIIKGSDGSVYYECRSSDSHKKGPKQSYKDRKTPEGFYRVEEISYPHNGAQIEINYPNRYDKKLGRENDEVLIKGSDYYGIKNRSRRNGDIVVNYHDMIRICDIIKNSKEKTLIMIEDKKRPLNKNAYTM